MNKLEAVKYGTKLVVGISTSYAVGNIIKNNVAADTLVKKGEVLVASLVIGNLVSEHAEKHVVKAIDKFVADWKNRNQTTTEA